MHTNEEKQFILHLARQAIEFFFDNRRRLEVTPEVAAGFPQSLRELGACFVTLKTNIVELRGCIGTIEAYQPLYKDIVDNATAAAFDDTRFFPLTKEEYADIEIEVSVLTPPKKLDTTGGSEAILDRLEVGVDGVIVKKSGKSATYLPQVWDEMLEKHNFLSSLCLKAGLEPDDWQKEGTEIFTYQVEIVNDEVVPALA